MQHLTKESLERKVTFVEDTAILIPNCAIITQPGAKSRKGEIDSVDKMTGLGLIM